MSDINITKTIYVDAQPVAPVNKPSSVHENAGLNVNAPEPAQQSAPAYEDVVAVSKDGDTVQAKPESYERLSDGFVFSKAKDTSADDKNDEVKAASEAAEQKAAEEHVRESSEMMDERSEARIKEAIRESQEKASQAKEILQDQIEEKAADTKAADRAAVNYSSMSGADLERMYLDGRISSYAYNQEIESRKTEIESAGRDNAKLSEAATEAQTQLDANESLGKAMTAEEFGAGYDTKAEQELAREALFGKEAQDSSTSTAAFEVNLTK